MANENYYADCSIVDRPALWRPVTASSVTSIKGHGYQILVRCPAGRPPPAGWPIAYVLDHRLFTAAERYPSASGILVGIGYEGQDRRVYDYTPCLSLYGVSSPSQPEGTGGADDFLDFLRLDLKAWLQARYPIDIGRLSLVGHSLGGLFALHALFQRSAAFQTYLVSSPSVWWADRFLAKAALKFVAQVPDGAVAARVAITVGEYEQSLSPAELEREPEYREQQLTRRTARRMVDGSWQLAQLLQNVGGLDVSFQVLKGQTHAMAGPRSLLEQSALIFPE